MTKKQRKARPKIYPNVIQSVKIGPKWTYITMRVPTSRNLIKGTDIERNGKKCSAPLRTGQMGPSLK
jgi:hypothetical protein